LGHLGIGWSRRRGRSAVLPGDPAILRSTASRAASRRSSGHAGLAGHSLARPDALAPSSVSACRTWPKTHRTTAAPFCHRNDLRWRRDCAWHLAAAGSAMPIGDFSVLARTPLVRSPDCIGQIEKTKGRCRVLRERCRSRARVAAACWRAGRRRFLANSHVQNLAKTALSLVKMTCFVLVSLGCKYRLSP
jgi:hypothetical protein